MSGSSSSVSKTAALQVDEDEMRGRILDTISEQAVIDREKLVGSATLDELGVQSIDMVMILNEIEEAFGVYVPIDQTIADVTNLDEFIDHVIGLVKNPPPDPYLPASNDDGDGSD